MLMGYWDRLGEGFCDLLGDGVRGKGDTAGFLLHDGNETFGERCGSAFSLLVALGGMTFGLARGAYWSWGLGQSNKWGEGGKEEGKVCGIHRKWGNGEGVPWMRLRKWV